MGLFKKDKAPSDLGIKVVSKQEAFWTNVIAGCKAETEQNERAIEHSKEMLLVATRRLQELQRKAKPTNPTNSTKKDVSTA